MTRRIAALLRSVRSVPKAFRSMSSVAEAMQEVDFPRVDPNDLRRLQHLRNIGISAHIDSGKTTLTERILFYTGRIDQIHEVRGKDNVGAKMDSMELEREKGITIQSAATYTKWGNCAINIIDTPGHVDFTIEVERALRVLDGAVLVLCAVGGVQSQTMTVDRQMKRYSIPRLCFINKMDRAGANPIRVSQQIVSKLHINAFPLQLPIGAEVEFKGVVDVVRMLAYYNEGSKGETIAVKPVPTELLQQAEALQIKLIENLANIDAEMEYLFLNETKPTADQLIQAIRRCTLARTFVPIFMGSAYHNKAVQPMLDGVLDYLPSPHEVTNYALDVAHNEKQLALTCASSEPLVSLAFKLEESRFGQLTYLRVYQGTLARGDTVVNARTGKKVKVARLVRMHSNEMEDVESVGSGEICAIFGIECASGDTFTNGAVQYSMTSIYVPKAVISLSIKPKGKDSPNFSKALSRFQREDPTFRVHFDNESKEVIISGMGELHLEIYVERMKREYGVDCITGKPQVAYRETITERCSFNYLHKKQSGGSGQYAGVTGYMEPIPEDETVEDEPVQFVNSTVGMNIPSQYIPAIEKGFKEACEKGVLIGHPVSGVRFVLQDGASHLVDSSELAFRLATTYAFRETFVKAKPIVLQPIMDVSVTCPSEYQGNAIALVNRRKGTIRDSELRDESFEAVADVPLSDMFGFSTDLRSITQGKGEYSMTYKCHEPVLPNIQEQLIKKSKASAK